MFQIIALVVGAGIAGVLGLAATKPNSFSVQRKIRIAAPPETIFPLINDFRSWALWSPWEANTKVGRGRMKIMHVFMNMNMDKVVGRDFEKGLDAMKSIAESQLAAV